MTIWQFLPKGRKRRFKIESVRLGWAGLSWTVWYLQLTFLTIPFILSVFLILCVQRYIRPNKVHMNSVEVTSAPKNTLQYIAFSYSSAPCLLYSISRGCADWLVFIPYRGLMENFMKSCQTSSKETAKKSLLSVKLKTMKKTHVSTCI